MTTLDLATIIPMAVVATLFLQVVVSRSLRVREKALHDGDHTVKVEDLQHEGLHLARRVQHAATGLLFYGISYTDLTYRYRPVAVATLLVCSLGVYLVHLVRLRNPQVREFLARTYASILRPKELQGAIPGAFFFLLGVGLAGLAVTLSIEYGGNAEEQAMIAWRLGLLYLSLGDPIAAIVGTYVSSRQREKTPGKTWYGSLACFITCALCTLGETSLHMSDRLAMNHELILLVVVGGFIGMFAERFSIGDDNLSIPLLSTGVLLTLQHSRLQKDRSEL